MRVPTETTAAGLASICSLFLTCAAAAEADGAAVQLTLGGGALGGRLAYGASGDVAIRGSYAKTFGRLDVGLSLAAGGGAQAVNADGSYLNLNFGGWVLGVGAVDRNWSYSPNTSLILSSNARPMPAGYVKRDLSQSASPLLSWVGPWGGEFLLGRGEGNTFMGARLELEPVAGLKVELVQAAQSSGGVGTLGAALFGDTNDGAGAEINKVAGVGLSYARGGDRLYVQAIGEDEAGGFPSCFMYLAGLERRVDVGGAPTTINLEWVDTRIDFTEGGFCGPNTAYNNGTHPYTYRGAVMGAPIDSEGRSVALRVSHDFGSYGLGWGLGHYIVNGQSSGAHRLSASRQSGMIYHVEVRRPLGGAVVSGRVSYQDFDLERGGIGSGLAVAISSEFTF